MLGGQNDGVQVGQVVVRLPLLVRFVKLDLLLLRVFRDRPLRGRAVRGWWRVSAHFIGGYDRTEITKGNLSRDSAALRATRYMQLGRRSAATAHDDDCTRLCPMPSVRHRRDIGVAVLERLSMFRPSVANTKRLHVRTRTPCHHIMPSPIAKRAKRSHGHRHIGTSLHGAGDMLGR